MPCYKQQENPVMPLSTEEIEKQAIRVAEFAEVRRKIEEQLKKEESEIYQCESITVNDNDKSKVKDLLAEYLVDFSDHDSADYEEADTIEETLVCLLHEHLICNIDLTGPPGSWIQGQLLAEYYESIILNIDHHLPDTHKISNYSAKNTYSESESKGFIEIRFNYENKKYSWGFDADDPFAAESYYEGIIEWGMSAAAQNLYIFKAERLIVAWVPKEFIRSLGAAELNNSLHLLNETVVFTGKLALNSREAYRSLVQLHGARTQTRVGNKSTILVCGTKPGKSLVEKAESLGITIFTESELQEKYGLSDVYIMNHSAE